MSTVALIFHKFIQFGKFLVALASILCHKSFHKTPHKSPLKSGVNFMGEIVTKLQCTCSQRLETKFLFTSEDSLHPTPNSTQLVQSAKCPQEFRAPPYTSFLLALFIFCLYASVIMAHTVHSIASFSGTLLRSPTRQLHT